MMTLRWCQEVHEPSFKPITSNVFYLVCMVGACVNNRAMMTNLLSIENIFAFAFCVLAAKLLKTLSSVDHVT
jgi:hypothetical protein